MKNYGYHNKDEVEREKKNLLGFFFRRNKFDNTYAPDLKHQWKELNRKDRRIFLTGAIVGLIVFLSLVAILFFLMSNLFQF